MAAEHGEQRQARGLAGRIRNLPWGFVAIAAVLGALLGACGDSRDTLTELRALTPVPEGVPLLVYVYSDP